MGICGASYEISPITGNMKSAANQIIDRLSTKNSVAYERLSFITDTFGPRFTGSESLENALTYVRDSAKSDNLVVSEMETLVPHCKK